MRLEESLTKKSALARKTAEAAANGIQRMTDIRGMDRIERFAIGDKETGMPGTRHATGKLLSRSAHFARQAHRQALFMGAAQRRQHCHIEPHGKVGPEAVLEFSRRARSAAQRHHFIAHELL